MIPGNLMILGRCILAVGGAVWEAYHARPLECVLLISFAVADGTLYVMSLS